MAQNVLITAGAAGIGRAIACAFIESGANVHIVDVDTAAITELRAAKLDGNAARKTAQVQTSVADVASEAAVDEVFARHQELFGGLDVLINCAGVKGPTARLEEISLTDWRRCIAVNLDAAFLCARRAIPMLRATATAGCVINISSTAGWHGYPLRTPYASAKWGLLGLTKSMAMELGPAGIRVNAICPGSVDGARMQRVMEAEAAQQNVSPAEVRLKYTRGVSLRTFIDAEDVAALAVFLASAAAAKITGQAISIDGHTENIGGMTD